MWRYAYDASQRRVLSQQGASAQSDFTTGTQRSAFMDGSHRLKLREQATTYNANGQPERVGNREYVWDALGRLIEVLEEAWPLAQYRYDHQGLRIGIQVEQQTTHTLNDESRQHLAELNSQGHIVRQCIYFAEEPHF